MRIRYAQGWQWTVEVDGLNGFDMFVKDITYSSGNIETESKVIGSVEFSKPTYVSAGPVTMTVRDTEDGKIMDWFKERRSRVTNPDGTINLPPEYLMKIRVYRVTQDGGKELEEEMRVFPTQLGEITRSRDQVSEFLSYPITFQKYIRRLRCFCFGQRCRWHGYKCVKGGCEWSDQILNSFNYVCWRVAHFPSAPTTSTIAGRESSAMLRAFFTSSIHQQ